MKMRRTRLVSHIRALPLERIHLWMTNAIFLAFFLSIWKFKLWYVVTMGVVAVTALMGVTGALRLRGLLTDVAPLVAYFGYLYIAAGWSAYADEARWWVAADSISIFVFCLFWIVARNNGPEEIMQAFVRIMIVAAIGLSGTYRPEHTRFGGYAVAYIPAALPFIWAALVGRSRRFSAALALGFCLTILLISRSRAPLLAGGIALGLSMLFIGRNLAQRVRLAAAFAVAGALLLAAMLSYQPTKFALLTFVARITHEDVLTTDFYIAGEPEDATRDNLRAVVRAHLSEVQPFGAGYMTTARYYERMYYETFVLHDIYQTWTFEGGVFCVFFISVVLMRHVTGIRQARRLATTTGDATLIRCIEVATLATLVMGLFHQMHHGPVLYSILGMGLGARARVAAQRVTFRRALAIQPALTHYTTS